MTHHDSSGAAKTLPRSLLRCKSAKTSPWFESRILPIEYVAKIAAVRTESGVPYSLRLHRSACCMSIGSRRAQHELSRKYSESQFRFFSWIIGNARVGLSRNERSYGLLAPGHSPDLTRSLATALTSETTASRALSGGIRLDVQRQPVRSIGGVQISAVASWPLDISCAIAALATME